MKVMEVEGCRSSLVRALVAKASGPGFASRRQPIFFIFSLAFPFKPQFIHNPYRWHSDGTCNGEKKAQTRKRVICVAKNIIERLYNCTHFYDLHYETFDVV